MASFGGRVSIDLGTGDGRLPYVRAQQQPDRLFIGVDANAAGMRELSGRALRDRIPNLMYVRTAVEELPAELSGAADRVSVVLPWGSLLAGLARPVAKVIEGIRALCRPGAGFTIVLGVDPTRDQAEARRLGMPPLDLAHIRGPLASAYATAGFSLQRLRPMSAAELALWPSTWAKRLAHGRPRNVFEIEARAIP